MCVADGDGHDAELVVLIVCVSCRFWAAPACALLLVCCAVTGSDGAGGQWDMEVASRFADRPMLKALHKKFPGGAPAPEEPPYVNNTVCCTSCLWRPLPSNVIAAFRQTCVAGCSSECAVPAHASTVWLQLPDKNIGVEVPLCACVYCVFSAFCQNAPNP